MGNYIFVDANCTNIAINTLYNLDKDTNLHQACKLNNCRIITIPITQLMGKKIAPLAFLTCVELVKRVLGIHKRSIVTPYKLYKYLQRMHT